MIKNKIYSYEKAKKENLPFIDFLKGFVDTLNLNLIPENVTISNLDYITSLIKGATKIAIIGDYDVDGITSSSIIYKALKALGKEVKVILPDRFTNGYGASATLIEKAIKAGVDTIITVDNGINATAALMIAKKAGLSVIVTDHHLPNNDDWKQFEDRTLNPQCVASNLKNKMVCGAYVALILAISLLGKGHSLIPELKELAAVGTIADCMPIKYENKTLLYFCQQEWQKGIVKNTGINLLINTLGKFDLKDMEQENIGFYLSPCLNASGRLRTADISFEILNEPFSKELCQKALNLVSLNTRRQELTSKAGLILKNKINPKNKVQIINFKDEDIGASDREMEGIIGLIAQKCVDLSNCPSLIFYGNKFSGRSVPDVNLHKLISSASDKVKSLSFGGHVGACGGKIDFDKDYEVFQATLNENVDMASFEAVVPYIRIPKDMDLKEVNDAVMSLKPCDKLPEFIMDDLKIYYPSTFAEKHTSFKIKVGTKFVKVIKFNEILELEGSIKRLIFKTTVGYKGDIELFAERIIK